MAAKADPQQNASYLTEENGGVPAETSYLRNNEAVAEAGIFKYDNLLVTQAPGNFSAIYFEVSGLYDNGITKTMVSDPQMFVTYSRSCVSGEE